MTKLPLAERPTSIRYVILLLACFTSFFLYLHRYTWNIVGPKLEQEYGFSSTAVGAIHTCFSASYGFGQIPSGMLSDFFGPHVFLGVIIVAWSLGLMFLGRTGNYPGLCSVMFGFGAAQAGGYPNLTKVTERWFPKKSRTTVQGLVATFFGRGGGAMSPIIMATILMGFFKFSWQSALIVMSLMGVVFGVLFLFFFRNDPATDPRVNEAEVALIRGSAKQTDATTERVVLPFRQAMKNRSFLLFLFQQTLNAGADNLYSVWIGKYFLEAKGVELATGGLLISLPLWGGAFGGLFGGYCNDFLIRLTGSRKAGRRIVGFTGKALACALMFVVITRDSSVGAGVALFAVKFFSDWSQPTVWGTCTDMGGRYSATIFGMLNTAGTVGGLICPVLFGKILDLNTTGVGAAKVTNFTPLFVVVATMYIVCAVCWLLIDATDSLDRGETSKATD